jgi:hypothetical protein
MTWLQFSGRVETCVVIACTAGPSCTRTSGRPGPRDGCGPGHNGRGTGAARRSAPGVAGPDQVLESAAGVVASLGAGVVAGAAGQGNHADVQAGRAGRGMPAGQAGMGGGGTVGVHRGQAPSSLRVAGGGGDQVAGIIGIEGSEPVGLAWCLGPAPPRGQGDGEGDQRGQAGPGRRGGSGTGTRTTRAGAFRTARCAIRAVVPAGSGAGRSGRVAVGRRLVSNPSAGG